MGNTTTSVQAPAQAVLTLADLPALGAHHAGGTFAGLHTSPEGTHYALILLADKPDTEEGRLTWSKALEWAKALDADLPTRAEGQQLFANLPQAFVQGWHWTNTQYSRDYAWAQNFADGIQYDSSKVYVFRARAVRRLVIGSSVL